MLLDRNWVIESDKLNVKLMHRKVSKKTDKDVWAVEGYYSTLANALKGMVTLRINQTGMRTVEGIQKEIDKLYKLIDTKVKPK